MVSPKSPLSFYYHPDRRPFEKLPLAKGRNIFYFNPDDRDYTGVVNIKDGGFNMPEVCHRYYQCTPPSPKTLSRNSKVENKKPSVKEKPKRKPTENEVRGPEVKEKPNPRVLPKPYLSKKNSAKLNADRERRPRFIGFSPKRKSEANNTAEYVEIQQPDDELLVAESPIVAQRRNITHNLPDDFGNELFNEDADSDVISTCSSCSTLSDVDNVPKYTPLHNDNVFAPGLNMREIKPSQRKNERGKMFKESGSSDTFLVSSISYSISSSEDEEEEEKKGPPKINKEESSTFRSTRLFQRQDALSLSEVGKTDNEGPEDIRYAVLKFQDFSDIENYNSEGNDSGFVRKIARLSNSMSDLTSIDSGFDKSIEVEMKISTTKNRDHYEKKEVKVSNKSFQSEPEDNYCPYCSIEDENTKCDSDGSGKHCKSEKGKMIHDKGLLKIVDREGGKSQKKVDQRPEEQKMISEDTIKENVLTIQKSEKEFLFDEPFLNESIDSSIKKERMTNNLLTDKKGHLMDKVIDVNKNNMYGKLRVDINFDDHADGDVIKGRVPYKTDDGFSIVGDNTKLRSVDIDVPSTVNKKEGTTQKDKDINIKSNKLKYVKEKEKRPRMIFQDTFDLSVSENDSDKNEEKEKAKSTKIGDIVIATKDVVLNVNYPQEKKAGTVKRNNSFESNEDIRKWIQNQIKHFKTIQIELDESNDDSEKYVKQMNQKKIHKGKNIKKKAKFFENKDEDGECESENNDLTKMMFIKEYVQNIIEDMLRKKREDEIKEKIVEEEKKKKRNEGDSEKESDREQSDVAKLEFIKEYVRGIVENVVVEKRKELIVNKIDISGLRKTIEVPASKNEQSKTEETKQDIIKLNAIGQYIQNLIDNVIQTRWDELSKNIATDVIDEVGDVIENVIEDLINTKSDDQLPIPEQKKDIHSPTRNELLVLKDISHKKVEHIKSDSIKEITMDKNNYLASNINIEEKTDGEINVMPIQRFVNPSVEIHVIEDEENKEIQQVKREDKELVIEEIKDVKTLEKTFHENDDVFLKLVEAEEEEKRKTEEEKNKVNEYVRNLINDVINDRYNEICEQKVTDIPLSDDYNGDESNNETDLDDMTDSLSSKNQLHIKTTGKDHTDESKKKNENKVEDNGTYFYFMDAKCDGNDPDTGQFFFESDNKDLKNDDKSSDKGYSKNDESGIDTKSEDLWLDDNTVPSDGLFIRNIDTGEVIPISEVKEEKLNNQNICRSDVVLDSPHISDGEIKRKDDKLTVDLDIVSSPKTLMQEMIDSDLPLLLSTNSTPDQPKSSPDIPAYVSPPASKKRPMVNRKTLYRKLSATFYNPCEDIFRQAEVMEDAMERYREFKQIHDDSRTYENIVRWKDELVESFHKRNFGII